MMGRPETCRDPELYWVTRNILDTNIVREISHFEQTVKARCCVVTEENLNLLQLQQILIWRSVKRKINKREKRKFHSQLYSSQLGTVSTIPLRLQWKWEEKLCDRSCEEKYIRNVKTNTFQDWKSRLFQNKCLPTPHCHSGSCLVV